VPRTTYKSNKIKIGKNEMRVINSKMSMKKRNLVNTGDISPEINTNINICSIELK